MVRFFVGQKWITADGTLHGEIIEIFDEGRSGVLAVTDDKGNVHRETMNAAEIQVLGFWRVAT
jgi:hypothetical protein